MNLVFNFKFGTYSGSIIIDLNNLAIMTIEEIYQFLLNSIDVPLDKKYVIKIKDIEGKFHKLINNDDLVRFHDLILFKQNIDIIVQEINGFLFTRTRDVIKTKSSTDILPRRSTELNVGQRNGYTGDVGNIEEIMDIREPLVGRFDNSSIDEIIENEYYNDTIDKLKNKYNTTEKLLQLEMQIKFYNNLKNWLVKDDVEDKDKELIQIIKGFVRSNSNNPRISSLYVKILKDSELEIRDDENIYVAIWNNSNEIIPSNSIIQLSQIVGEQQLQKRYSIGFEPILPNEVQIIKASNFKPVESRQNSIFIVRLYKDFGYLELIAKGVCTGGDFIKLEKVTSEPLLDFL